MELRALQKITAGWPRPAGGRALSALVAAGMAALLLASCVKDDLHDTPHPDRGVVAVTPDFPEGSGDDYTVEVDGNPVDSTVSDPLLPGEHTVLAYNTPGGFTIVDGVAYVNTVDKMRALSTLIDPLPGHLYSGTRTVTVAADDTLRVAVDVRRRTRDLRLELTVTEGDPERVTGVTGTLSGVAGAYDLRRETLAGEAVITSPAFTREGDRITADLRLLGTMGEAQTLTLTITFADGQSQTTESDLTEALASFNADPDTPFTLAAGLRTPMEAGFSATITDWETVDVGDVDIH